MDMYNKLLPYLFEGVYVVDRNRKIIFWNKSSELITGYTSEEVVNKHCFSNILRHVTVDGKELCFDGCPVHKTLASGKTNKGEVFLHHKDGHRIPVSVKTFPIYGEDDKISGAIEVFTDTRDKDEAFIENRRLKKLLIMDELTKIYNRRHLDLHLKTMKQEADEYQTSFGVLFFDIDHFKNVNDTYGHLVGDRMLQMIARTLKSNIRGEDIVGRWGGEEFLSIVRASDASELKYVAEKLRVLCKGSSLQEADKELSVTLSIGGTMYLPGEPLEAMVKRADDNMYGAKDSGRNKSIIK